MNNERWKYFKSSAFLHICYPPSIVGHLPFVIRHLFLMLDHIHEMCPIQALARKMP